MHRKTTWVVAALLACLLLTGFAGATLLLAQDKDRDGRDASPRAERPETDGRAQAEKKAARDDDDANDDDHEEEDFAIKVVPLKHQPAMAAMQTLRELLHEKAMEDARENLALSANEPANAIVLAGAPEAVGRLTDVLVQLDKMAGERREMERQRQPQLGGDRGRDVPPGPMNPAPMGPQGLQNRPPMGPQGLMDRRPAEPREMMERMERQRREMMPGMGMRGMGPGRQSMPGRQGMDGRSLPFGQGMERRPLGARQDGARPQGREDRERMGGRGDQERMDGRDIERREMDRPRMGLQNSVTPPLQELDNLLRELSQMREQLRDSMEDREE